MIVQCKCDCGTEFEEYNKWGYKREYVKGHHSRGKHRSPWNKGLTKETNSSVLETSKKLTGQIRSDEHKRNISINHADFKGEKHPMFGKYHSPETRQKMSGKPRSDATKEKIRIGNTGKIVSKATKQLISVANIGENNPNWQGGISKLPYCPIWTKWFKKEVKERDDFECKNPDCDKEITKNNLLCVHHIDYDKKNCSTDNLITLCSSCNGKANHNREHWINFYSNIINKEVN